MDRADDRNKTNFRCDVTLTTNGTFQRVTYRVDSGIYYVQQLLLTKNRICSVYMQKYQALGYISPIY